MRKLKIKRFHFNMIEIVLAIAILAFGFASVLGLFPVALKAVRNSQAEGLANSGVNNLYVYYKSYARTLKSPGNYFYKDLFDDNTMINWTESTMSKLRLSVKDKSPTNLLYGHNFLDKLKNSADPTTAPALGFQPGMSLFQPENGKTCFYLVLGSADFRKTEFTAQIILWKEQVSKLITTTTPSPIILPYSQAVELNMEVSWPINIPYSEREKRYYQFVITSPLF